jgi:hypothetical protein
MEGEAKIEQEPRESDYNFEEGSEEAATRIRQLLDSQKYVMVAIIGSSNDVGKTSLCRTLSEKLSKFNILVDVTSEIAMISETYHFSSRVIILGSEGFPYNDTKIQDKALKSKMNQVGLPISKIDLRIFIYRPDRPFDKRLKLDKGQASMVIKNEGAIDALDKERH